MTKRTKKAGITGKYGAHQIPRSSRQVHRANSPRELTRELPAFPNPIRPQLQAPAMVPRFVR